MSLNYLLIAGYILGVLWSIANKEYEFTFFTPTGKQNIFKSIVAGMIVMVVWYFAFYVQYDDNIYTGTTEGVAKFGLICVFYFFTGFCIEYVIKVVSKFYKQYLGKKLEEKSNSELGSQNDELKDKTDVN